VVGGKGAGNQHPGPATIPHAPRTGSGPASQNLYSQQKGGAGQHAERQTDYSPRQVQQIRTAHANAVATHRISRQQAEGSLKALGLLHPDYVPYSSNLR